MPLELVPPGEDVDAQHSSVATHASASKEDLQARWMSPEGVRIVETWAAGNFNRSYLESKIGRFFGKIDLRGVNLSAKNLSNVDLGGCDFYGAVFRKAHLVQSNLDFSYFSEADIRGADLSWSSARDAFFDNVIFDQATKLLGVPLQSVNFNLAALLYDQARTEQRIAHLERRSPRFAVFLKWTCDYGRSVSRWTLWAIAVMVFYAGIFYLSRDGIKGCESFTDAIYFSVITFTTLGYGDIVPITTITKLMVMTEVLVGYVMAGLLVAILAKRMIGD